MVQLKLDSQDGADFSIWIKILIFLFMFGFRYLTLDLYRKYPFITFYICSLLIFSVPLSLYSNIGVIPIINSFLVSIPFFTISLWRISCITEDSFNDHFIWFLPNYFVYRRLKQKFSQNAMEMFCAICLVLHIVWTVALDFAVGSYSNGCCGLVLASTVPLPASIGWNAPGYSVDNGGEEVSEEEEEEQSQKGRLRLVDVVVPDLHWFWIMIYTSWYLLFDWMSTLNLYTSILQVIPCYLYCGVTSPRWDLYFMLRILNSFEVTQLYSPWDWTAKLLGEPVIIEEKMVPIIWGCCHLVLALMYLVFYIGFVWRPRIYSTATEDVTQLEEVVSVAGHGHTDNKDSPQKSLSYGEDSEYAVYK